MVTTIATGEAAIANGESLTQSERVDVSVFDTRSQPPAAQVDVWRESIGVLFDVELAPDAGRSGYAARLDSAMAGPAMVTRVRAGKQAFNRSQFRSFRDGIDGVMFQVFTRGDLRHRDDTRMIAGRNALVGFDLTRDMATVNSDFDLVSIIFPREAIESRIGDVSGLHLNALGAEGGLGALTAGFIVSLQRTLDGMDSAEAEVASNAAADLIAECYRGQTRRSQECESHRLALVTRGTRFVRSRVAEGLPVDVSLLCSALSCSRATLYRAFASVGGVAALIRAERLRACLADLASRSKSKGRLTLGELAMRRGFESDAQFSRAFKAEYGLTPSEARRALMDSPAVETARNDGTVDRRYEIWLRAIGAA